MVSTKSEKKEAPDFFKNLKEKFLNQIIEMGYDYAEVEDYLEDHGLCELRHELLINSIKQPNFKNPLYTKPSVNIANESYNYGMYDPK